VGEQATGRRRRRIRVGGVGRELKREEEKDEDV
jgi:hypothetical protein